MGTQPRKGFARVEPRKLAVAPESVEVADKPTLEQCETVAVALGFPILSEGLRPPYYAESMLNLHRLVQRMADGDDVAARTLGTLQAAFGART